MRLLPHEAALAALEAGELAEGFEEAVPFDREGAVEYLQLFTAKNFGDDVRAWRNWFQQQSAEYIEACYTRIEQHVAELKKSQK